jgi:xyloglucan fucosyltransferase
MEDISPWNLTADHLLDGLLTPEFSYGSCRSRYEFAGYHKKSSRKPSAYLIAKLRKHEALQKRCGPGTAPHEKALRRLESAEGVTDDADDSSNDCRYLVYISYRGLGNRMLAIASAFLYAVLTDRVLLVDGGKDVADLFCEPFPGTTWLLPRAAGRWRSPLRRLQSFDGESKESLGNMLRSGAVSVSADGGNVWTPPAYVYLHLAGGYGFHDKLFFCGAHQRLLRGVPWLLVRTDNYVVPGLFLTPPFRDELERMFPEKDAAFHHVGRYLFHPSNAVWHAVTSYYRARLAGAGRRIGVQIRVFHKEQPRQHVLNQVLACVRDEALLPPLANDTSSVLVTSLSSWYLERIRDEFGGGVHQPSHEGRQRLDDAAHDMRALSEILLLSTCDVLVTSGFSTFGYVAQGLAGLRPWVMARPPMWAKDWREGIDQDEAPCRRMASVEPCFHTPSAYDCAAGRDVDLDKATPYIRRCVDVRWGIKLVNETSSQW